MTENRSFRDHCLVACAILQPELSYLQEAGFLDAKCERRRGPGPLVHAGLAQKLENDLSALRWLGSG
ncbi:MAG: hypothetical protein ACUVR4_04160 [Anaerolineae bacterium]